ncbi:hypothetical protein DPMN_017458 [Dreissena polymorpha]|uniref:Uncharacterized protein n=2 Tax=Dreissena polymorpha TaxID=45954 RepID=A0A9D4S6E1_DREPO|nr:hypothetical protein DPMN_017458 [Dreissena polymorpha]
MEVVDFDTSHGFRAGCMPKDLCIPPSNEQIVGRSSSTVHTNCCDTDRCNIPSTTTTTTTATTTTRLTPSSNCYDNINVNCNALFACALHPLKCARTCGHCR